LSGTQGTAHHEQYEGHPRSYNPDMQLEKEPADLEPRRHDGMHDVSSTHHLGHQSNTSGPHSSNFENKLDPRVDSDRDGRSGLGSTGAGFGSGTGAGSGYGSSGPESGIGGVGDNTYGIGQPERRGEAFGK